MKKRIDTGIYQTDNDRFLVVASVGDRKTGRRKEQRFPKGTSLRRLRQWRDDTRAELRRTDLRPARGTLAADVPLYLERMKGVLDFPDDRKYEIDAWLPVFGHRRRDTITDNDIEKQVRDWQHAGDAASTIKHRLSALSKLYRELDGKRAYNPVATVERPKEPLPSANGVPLESVLMAFDAFEARVKRTGRGRLTLFRLKVIAMTGMRHSQVMRLQLEDFWFDADPPQVVVRKPGKRGRPHVKPLTGHGVDACKAFIAENAFGKFSQSSAYKSWKLACTEAGVPFFYPYRLRHTWGSTLRREGMDLADVRELFGHASAKTTERYADVAPEKLVKGLEALDRAWSHARDNVSRQSSATATRGTTAWQQPEAIEKTGA